MKKRVDFRSDLEQKTELRANEFPKRKSAGSGGKCPAGEIPIRFFDK